MSIPPGKDTEKSSIGGTLIKWNSPIGNEFLESDASLEITGFILTQN